MGRSWRGEDIVDDKEWRGAVGVGGGGGGGSVGVLGEEVIK